MAAENPSDHSATLQLAHIALLSDRLDDAQRWLEKAITLQPGDDAKVMLAEVCNCPGCGLGSEQAEGIRQGCRIAGQGVDDGPALLLGG